MNIKIGFISVILLSFLVLPIAPEEGSAANISELEQKIDQARREREALVEEQRRLEAELSDVSLRGQSLASTVKSLDTTRTKLANDIKITQSRISATSLNIQKLESSMDDTGRRISVHKQALAATLKALADQSSNSVMLNLLASNSLSDIWDREGKVLDLNERLQSEIEFLRVARTELGSEKEKRERSKNELLGLHGELDGQKQVVEESKLAQERLLALTKSEEAAYKKMLADNLARQKQFEDELFKFESELKLVLDPTLIPPPLPGTLSWPLDYVYVTQRFGKTSASGRLYASGTHNGVDFRASMGTPVKAVMGGTIEGVGNTDEQKGCYSYGRWILVRHPNGLSSVYSHLSGSLVSKGKAVKTGEVIGYAGGTPGVFGSGYSTGPHLHLGLFATQGVEVRQFTTSINCKQVSVPIADPSAYLDPLAYLPLGN